MIAVVFDSGLCFAVHLIVGLLVESCARGWENTKNNNKYLLPFRLWSIQLKSEMSNFGKQICSPIAINLALQQMFDSVCLSSLSDSRLWECLRPLLVSRPVKTVECLAAVVLRYNVFLFRCYVEEAHLVFTVLQICLLAQTVLWLHSHLSMSQRNTP